MGGGPDPGTSSLIAPLVSIAMATRYKNLKKYILQFRPSIIKTESKKTPLKELANVYVQVWLINCLSG